MPSKYFDPASLHCGATPGCTPDHIAEPLRSGVRMPALSNKSGESNMDDDGFHGERRSGDGCEEDRKDGAAPPRVAAIRRGTYFL